MEFKAEPRHFFKIVLKQTLRDKKLQIPKAFVKKYGDQIPGKVLLEDPTGAAWKVEVARCNGEVWLHNGWEVFAEHYALRFGHFLLFGYEGSGHFRVTIFDKSATEIKYPSPRNCPEDSSSGGAGEDGTSIEILDGNSKSGKMREKSRSPCPRPQKMMRTRSMNRAKKKTKSVLTCQDLSPERTTKRARNLDNSNDQQCTFSPANEAGEIKSSRKGNGRSSAAKRFQTEHISRRTQLSMSNLGEADALLRARNFDSENPFFVVKMWPTSVNPAGTMRIPREFAERYFIQKHVEVILQVSERSWTVAYNYAVYSGKVQTRFSCHWKQFVQDNNLSVGDVCVFELLKGRNVTFKVTIFRAKEEACNGSLPGQSKELRCKKSIAPRHIQSPSCLSNQGTFEDARSFASKDPSYEFVLQKHHLKLHQLHLPSWFVSKTMPRDDYITLQTANGSWTVRLLKIGSASCLSAGWSSFVKGNFLQVGDVCLLELIKTGDVVLKVSISRSTT